MVQNINTFACVKHNTQAEFQLTVSLYNQIVYTLFITLPCTRQLACCVFYVSFTTLNVCRQKQQSIQMQTVRYMYM